MKRFVPFLKSPPVVAVIRLNGMIAAGQRGLNDAGTAEMIERAFRKGKPVAVALAINSPGGSPAQSSLIAARIRRLAEEKKLPVTAFVEDAAASGGYWLACAADDIIVDANSIVGSIGVISASFGLHEAISRIGVERRVHTAGEKKVMLDPFRPERAEDVEHLKSLQEDVHKAFIELVKTRRGDALSDDPDLFSGAFWSGERAVALGLADRVGELRGVLKERFGKDVRIKTISTERGGWRRRLGLFGRFDGGTRIVDHAIAALEERLLWNRFGL